MLCVALVSICQLIASYKDTFEPYKTMFGDFKHEEKQRLLDMDDICQLENGTPIVACYNEREYQFGIYGKRHVIYQDCWTTSDDILVFSIEKCTIGDFFEDADVYEYIPDFEFDRIGAFQRTHNCYSEMRNKLIPAFSELRSVYGDDFTLRCMLGSEELFCKAFQNSKMGRHYTHPIYIAHIAPAHHHLLAIEEGFAIHFSDGGTGGANEIILESLEDIIYREGVPFTEVHYNHEEVEYRFLARNRALLVFSGRWNYAGYNLFLNNCEHFVTLCKTGRSQSGQIRDFFQDAVLIGLSLLTRRPQYASMVLARRLALFD